MYRWEGKKRVISEVCIGAKVRRMVISEGCKGKKEGDQ